MRIVSDIAWTLLETPKEKTTEDTEKRRPGYRKVTKLLRSVRKNFGVRWLDTAFPRRGLTRLLTGPWLGLKCGTLAAYPSN
jgi:hypothetical protein